MTASEAYLEETFRQLARKGQEEVGRERCGIGSWGGPRPHLMSSCPPPDGDPSAGARPAPRPTPFMSAILMLPRRRPQRALDPHAVVPRPGDGRCFIESAVAAFLHHGAAADHHRFHVAGCQRMDDLAVEIVERHRVRGVRAQDDRVRPATVASSSTFRAFSARGSCRATCGGRARARGPSSEIIPRAGALRRAPTNRSAWGRSGRTLPSPCGREATPSKRFSPSTPEHRWIVSESAWAERARSRWTRRARSSYARTAGP
jgi:hypothetical protein